MMSAVRTSSAIRSSRGSAFARLRHWLGSLRLRSGSGEREAAPRSNRHLRTGEWGERVAEERLRRDGYRIIGRRVRVGRRDEFDLIARSPQEVLVFVEVKTRANEDFGRPFSAVTSRKRRNLSRAALAYFRQMKQKPNYFRFDVVEVVGTENGPAPVVRHIENAFPLSGRRRIYW